MRRIVAREHSSLLDDETRLKYEGEFKSASANPDAPNVLVATPTLEMGIDIGDLSTVMLSSLPRTVASYLQRIGRAGRLTGNALALAFVTGRGEFLPRLGDPLSMINGQVRPPATYLSAAEILRRQYLAHLVDAFARTLGGRTRGRRRPRSPRPTRGASSARLSTWRGRRRATVWTRFLVRFPAWTRMLAPGCGPGPRRRRRRARAGSACISRRPRHVGTGLWTR